MFYWFVHGTNKHAYHSALFVTHFIFLLILCDVGMANIVVYEGENKIQEFNAVELPYAAPIDRNGIEGLLVAAYPLYACVNISRPPSMNLSINWFVLIAESSCSFETKIINAKLAGYSAAIIYTYKGRTEGFSSQHGHNGIYPDMPTVITNIENGIKLRENYLYTESKRFRLVIFPRNVFSVILGFILLFSIIAGLFLLVLLTFTVIRFFQQVHTTHNGRLHSQHLRHLQTTIFHIGDHHETCAICLEDYKDQDELRILPCSHGYHTKCIDPWLTNNRRICPVCKRKVTLIADPSTNSNFDENSPLIHSTRTVTHGTFNYGNDTTVNLDCNMPRSIACTRNMQPSTSAIIPPDTSQERYGIKV